MKTIVISGINLFEGGPLSIYHDCLQSIIENRLNETNEVIAFVHKKEIFSKYADEVTLIELPNSRKNYFYRLWYEYIYFYIYSKGKNIDVWLSLHDITPNVSAKRRYVYCHNSLPFYKMSKAEARFSPRLKLFNLFYKYLYKINIKKNDYVIVQQAWIKRKFMDLFTINNVIVAHPDTSSVMNRMELDAFSNSSNMKMFFYPSFPRAFKNFEVICEATQILADRGLVDFNIVLTLDGTENAYSNFIVNKYSNISNINFIGLLKREEVYAYYAKSSCLIFPAKLETWGLPITEYKAFEKPIIAADLDYAKETLGDYEQVCFFNPNKAEELATILDKVINNSMKWKKTKVETSPDSSSWKELLELLI